MDFQKLINRDLLLYGINGNRVKLEEIVWSIYTNKDLNKPIISTISGEGVYFSPTPIAIVKVIYNAYAGRNCIVYEYTLKDIETGWTWLRFGIDESGNIYFVACYGSPHGVDASHNSTSTEENINSNVESLSRLFDERDV